MINKMIQTLKVKAKITMMNIKNLLGMTVMRMKPNKNKHQIYNRIMKFKLKKIQIIKTNKSK